MTNQKPLEVAFFSMEVMLESDIPTYAGGLGVLAGDILRSCADLKVPAVGMTLVYSGDTFSQVINPDGTQTFIRTDWQKLDQLVKLPTRVEIEIAGQKVLVGCWRYDFIGINNFIVPVYLLDTNFLKNPPWIRNFTFNLYSSNPDTRICQEIVLGIAGVKMLRALGYSQIKNFHLNEGHTAFASLQLLTEADFQDDKVRSQCLFTTHTPVPEGHDKFDYGLAYHFAGKYLPWHIKKLAGDDCLSMTRLAMNLSKTSFAVSEKHQQVCEAIFAGNKFDYVTNGVHHRSWVAPTIQNLYDQFLPGWQDDPAQLIHAPDAIPDADLWAHHYDAKTKLVNMVNKHLTFRLPEQADIYPLKCELFNPEILTISLARRPVAYKRPLLLYRDIERFIKIGRGKLQIIQCGKSHPDDNVSQYFVSEILKTSRQFSDHIRIAYLENYSPKIGRILVSGSDLWLNVPKKPLEASGTSGMKAALNGVLNFSVLDGWWIEGYRANPDAGFPIGSLTDSLWPIESDAEDAEDLYTRLETEIIPMYYHDQPAWLKRMKQAITLGAIFNTHRVVSEYRAKAWKKR